MAVPFFLRSAAKERKKEEKKAMARPKFKEVAGKRLLAFKKKRQSSLLLA